MLKDHPYDVVNHVPMTVFAGVEGSRLYLVNTLPEWKAFYEILMTKKLVAADTETEGFQWYSGDRVVGLSFGWDNDHFYIPVRHRASSLAPSLSPQINMDDIRDDLKAFFAQKDVFTLWHNWKFDAHFYRTDDIEILTPFHDTRILWQFYDENAPGALKTIASGWKDELGRKHEGIVGPSASIKEKEIDTWRGAEAKNRRDIYRRGIMSRADELGCEIVHQDKSRVQLKKWIIENEFIDHPYREAKKDQIHYGYIPIPLMCEYAALDTYLTWRVYDFTMKNVQMDDKLRNLYLNELKLSRALFDAEEEGMAVDRAYLEESRVELQVEIAALEESLKERLGNINLNSTLQLATELKKQGVPLTKTTDSGRLALDRKTLDKLASKHEVVHDIIKLRESNKILNTYVEGILSKLVEGDILHCSFNQNVSTGRMSSADPNLQNIPGRDKRIRKAFVSPGGDYIYVFADYSQVEVRLTAHYSMDPLLLDSYAKEQDVHTRTMCEMFSLEYDKAVQVLADDKDPEYASYDSARTIAKRINFGIIYGVGAPGLSEQIPRPEQYKDLSDKEWIGVCQAYIDGYKHRYLGVKRFINISSREIKKYNKVTNFFGRVRNLPHANAVRLLKDESKFWLEGRAKRQGTNFLIQGTAADLFKIAVVRVHELFQGKKSKMINFVHDEIQAYIHKDELYLLNEMKTLMEDFNFAVPIIADFSYSKTNWAGKRKLG